MRIASCILFSILVTGTIIIRAEEAADFEERGASALKLSQTSSDAIVPAAEFFGKAAVLYEKGGDDAKAVEMNSFLYWCKKKMTLDQVNTFIKRGDEDSAALAKRLNELEKTAPKSDAAAYFDRAEKYAQMHANEHLLVAIRYFEVAERFKGQDESFKAQDRSLQEMQLALKAQGAAAPSPAFAPMRDDSPRSIKRAPTPAIAALNDSDKRIREVLKDEFAKPTLEARIVLMKHLEELIQSSAPGSADIYWALREGRRIAISCGSATVSCELTEKLNSQFEPEGIDGLSTVNKIMGNAKLEELENFAHFSALMKLSAIYVENQQFDKLKSLVSVAQSLLPKLNGPLYKPAFQAQFYVFNEIARQWSSAQPAMAKLKSTPNDPEAHKIVGEFLCATGDWEHGLPHLVQCADPLLKSLAQKDAENPTDVEQQVAVGTDWADRAKNFLPAFKHAAEERAAFWYLKAAPTITGLMKLKVDKFLSLKISADPGPAIPPVQVIKAHFGFEDKFLDFQPAFQKEFDTDPYAAFNGCPRGASKDVAPGKSKYLEVTCLCDGNLEEVHLNEGQISMPKGRCFGLPVSNSAFKILNVKVCVHAGWNDCTTAAKDLIKNENVDVYSISLWKGDPWPYVVKTVVCFWEVGGKRYSRIASTGEQCNFRP